LDIDGWLRGIGLAQYAQMFRANDIDIELLGRLSNDDLKEIGVKSLGHRKKLLEAIAERAGALPASLNAAIGPEAYHVAERRQVTVMFSDLVGSTALSARMDLEDLRELIAAYQKCVSQTVGRFGGFVAKYMGDGALIYFGYPQAHEDDAERAVRAGLELIAAVTALKSPLSLQTRIGIATGLVVVGDLVGSGEAQEHGIVGETPNLAARLQGVAEPNMVVIAEDTRRLVGNLFELQDLGSKDLKGIARPARAWAALRVSSVESRFEAFHARELTALVGREEELELLTQRWVKAKTGEGQVVLVSGEAGIGKSRLTAALLEHLASEPHTRLRYFCSPQHTDSALYPIIGQLERAAGLRHDDTPAAKLDKLDAMLLQTSTSVEDAALFAETLLLPNDGRYPALALLPEQRRQRTLDALMAQLRALAHASPVLMIFEDAHWSDPSSLELFGRIVDRVRTFRALLIVTFRPEFEPTWVGRPYVTTLTITRLAQCDIDGMIDRIVGNASLPVNLRRDIIERTDGVPLFVEEMTIAVLEAGNDGGAEHVASAAPHPGLAVPASLHASLMARLDRLGAAKEVAQIGGAIGREFSHALLAAVASKPGAELASALDRLVAAGLLFRRGVPPEATYLFKHALVQDAAYGTLLRERRRALHARIVEAIESQFADIAESQPELPARHCTEAGLLEKAAGLWGKAGQQSMTRSALIEAAAQFTRALACIDALTSTTALRRDQIKLQIQLADALTHVKGYAAPETQSAWRQARGLIEQAQRLGEPPDDPLLLFSVLFGYWLVCYVAFNGDLLHELAAELLALGQKLGAAAPLSVAYRILGITLAFTGDFVEARANYTQALALYDPTERDKPATRVGATDGRVVALAMRSSTLWLLGYPEAARADIDLAVKEARDLGEAVSLMLALALTNYANLLSGDHVAANALADELRALAHEKGAELRKAEAMFQQGCVFALTGRLSDAVQTITSGITACRATGSTVWTPLRMSFLAEAHARLGQFDDARRCIDEARAASEASKESWCDAEIRRLAGEIALLSGEPDMAEAEACFERALAIARQQQAKSFELRAAMSMARLLRDQGKRDEARDLLSSTYGWFTEGFDTRDLKDAKALLDELRDNHFEIEV
jgi:class 3 adenylate cyclase/predicted ATPase